MASNNSPAEKAKELVDKYTQMIFESGNTVSKPMCKQCALICVDEILSIEGDYLLSTSYWQQVKEEINKLP